MEQKWVKRCDLVVIFMFVQKQTCVKKGDLIATFVTIQSKQSQSVNFQTQFILMIVFILTLNTA